jgi:hypothetical protein
MSFLFTAYPPAGRPSHYPVQPLMRKKRVAQEKACEIRRKKSFLLTIPQKGLIKGAKSNRLEGDRHEKRRGFENGTEACT